MRQQILESLYQRREEIRETLSEAYRPSEQWTRDGERIVDGVPELIPNLFPRRGKHPGRAIYPSNVETGDNRPADNRPGRPQRSPKPGRDGQAPASPGARELPKKRDRGTQDTTQPLKPVEGPGRSRGGNRGGNRGG